MFTIPVFSYGGAQAILVSGTMQEMATTASVKLQQVSQAFAGIPAALASGFEASASNVSAAAVECQVLFFDLGPIFLGLLGLKVDLSQMILDIPAVGGSGNLVVHLLCAVVGLLDPLSGLLANLLPGEL